MNLHWFWQNLTTEEDTLRGIWKNGRASVSADTEHGYRRLVGVEWTAKAEWHGLTHVHASFNENERDVTLSASLFGVGLYLELPIPDVVIERLPFRYGRTEYSGAHRQIGVSVNDGAVRWSLWEDTHEGRRDDPRWMRGSVRVVDMILGKERHHCELVEERDVDVQMPEGLYPARAKLTRHRWHRPRLPAQLAEEATRVNLDFGEHPVWMPGKGENDYDMGDDGIFTASFKATSIEHAIGRFVDRAVNERLRRTGSPKPPPELKRERVVH